MSSDPPHTHTHMQDSGAHDAGDSFKCPSPQPTQPCAEPPAPPPPRPQQKLVQPPTLPPLLSALASGLKQ